MEISSELLAIVMAAIGLAGLILHSASRADRRMDGFQKEMLRLAERQSHIEGRLDERGAAAD